MAKPKVEEKSAPVAETAVAKTDAAPTGLPAVAKPRFAIQGASPELTERVNEVGENLESIENFQLPRAKMTAGGLELAEGTPPLTELEGVIVHTKKTKVYYDKPYNPSVVTPPTCFSPDGITPSDGAGMENYKKQSDACKTCKHNVFGTNTMGKGKACRDLKPIFLLLSVEPGQEAVMPRQLTITPTSIKNQERYLMNLTEMGVNYRKVKTKLSLFKENPKDTFFKIKFEKGSKLDDAQIKNVDALKNFWLPIMMNQNIDSSELAGMNEGTDAKPVDATGEY